MKCGEWLQRIVAQMQSKSTQIALNIEDEWFPISFRYWNWNFLLFPLDSAALSHIDEAARNVVNCYPPPSLSVKVRRNDALFITRTALTTATATALTAFTRTTNKLSFFWDLFWTINLTLLWSILIFSSWPFPILCFSSISYHR